MMGLSRTAGSTVLMMVVVAALAASCNSTGGSGAGSGEAPSKLQVRNDLQDLAPVPWTTYRVLDPLRLEFTVPSGTPECYGASVSLTQNDREISVGISIGRLASAASKSCPAIGTYSPVVVTLDSLLNNRSITDPNK